MRKMFFFSRSIQVVALTLRVACLLLASSMCSFADDLPRCSSPEGDWRPPCKEDSVCIENPSADLSCTYFVPRDCAKIAEIPYSLGANVAFKMGQGLQVLCDEIELEKAEQLPVRLDFVSQADWNALPIELLPFDLGCGGIGSASWFEWCEYVGVTNPSASFIDFFVWQEGWWEDDWRVPDSAARIGKGCQLKEGVLNLQFVQVDGQIECQPDDEPGGISFDKPIFGDFNGDGIKDVSFVVGWWGGGSGTTAYREKLTRISDSGPLIRLYELSVPFACESTRDAFEQAVCLSPRLRVVLHRIAAIDQYANEREGGRTAPPTLQDVREEALSTCMDGQSLSEERTTDATQCLAEKLDAIFDLRRAAVIAARDAEAGVGVGEPATSAAQSPFVWRIEEELQYLNYREPGSLILRDAAGNKSEIEFGKDRLTFAVVGAWNRGKKIHLVYAPESGTELFEPETGARYQIRAALPRIDELLSECIVQNSSTAGRSGCYVGAAEAWDIELNRYYKELMNSALSDETKLAIRTEQRQWIEFRDASMVANRAVGAELVDTNRAGIAAVRLTRSQAHALRIHLGL